MLTGLILFPIGTIAEGAPVIRISAHLKYNIDVVCEYITKKIPVPLRDFSSEPRLIGMFNFVFIAPLSDISYSDSKDHNFLLGGLCVWGDFFKYTKI